MISPYTTDLDRIHNALMTGNVDDLELIGNALAALVSIVRQQEKEIQHLKTQIQQSQQCK